MTHGVTGGFALKRLRAESILSIKEHVVKHGAVCGLIYFNGHACRPVEIPPQCGKAISGTVRFPDQS